LLSSFSSVGIGFGLDTKNPLTKNEVETTRKMKNKSRAN